MNFLLPFLLLVPRIATASNLVDTVPHAHPPHQRRRISYQGWHGWSDRIATLRRRVVVAPETNQSGASHSLSLHEPLRMRAIDERAFAVRGTPTDSVIMGVRHVLKEKPPDLVLSGVNRGANMAEDVTYSGTIAGAFEGTILGIRSMALSQAYGIDGVNG